MAVRDLAKDLEICKQLLSTPCSPDNIQKLVNEFFIIAREAWPEAIRRAMIAEKEAKIWREAYYSLNGVMDLLEAQLAEQNNRLTLLRKAVKGKCDDCVTRQGKTIEYCPFQECPLWPYREYKMSDKDGEQDV